MEEMHNRIKRLRLEKQISQEQLAHLVGYKDKTGVAKVEAGSVNLPQSKIYAFAKALGVSTSYLIDGDSGNSTNDENVISDQDIIIIQRERSKMSDKEKNKLMNILKANFDDYNWEEDDSGDIE